MLVDLMDLPQAVVFVVVVFVVVVIVVMVVVMFVAVVVVIVAPGGHALQGLLGQGWWKVFGRFAGEWREIASGVWKPGAHEHPAFTQRCRFRSETMPEAVRIEQHGFGEAAVRYVSVCDRTSRVRPVSVSAVSGNVRDAANVLTDDYSEVRLGAFGFLRQYYDASRGKAKEALRRIEKLTAPLVEKQAARGVKKTVRCMVVGVPNVEMLLPELELK